MYANALAFAWSLEPTSNANIRRTMFSTLAFATGAIVGWPFALAVAIPFAIEELFVHGRDAVTASNKIGWLVSRWTKFATCAGTAALLAVSCHYGSEDSR